MVPAQIALQLALIPALAVVREKELGSITNFYVTPVTRLQFIVGKQLPYVVISMVNFVVLVVMATTVFDVSLKEIFAALAVGTLTYVITTTGYGLLISSFARTQIAALFGTAILTVLPATQFAGMLTPVSTLSGVPALMGHLFPMSYYLPISSALSPSPWEPVAKSPLANADRLGKVRHRNEKHAGGTKAASGGLPRPFFSVLPGLFGTAGRLPVICGADGYAEWRGGVAVCRPSPAAGHSA